MKPANGLPRPSLRQAARLGGGLLLGGAAWWWAAADLSLAAIGQALRGVSVPGLLLATGCVVAVVGVKAVRWRRLYAPPRPPLANCFAALTAGQMVNLLIPIRLGDALRALLMKQQGWPLTASLVTIAAEKIIDLLAVLVIAAGLVATTAAPDWAVGSLTTRFLVLLGVGLIGGIAALLCELALRKKWLSPRLARWGERLSAAARPLSRPATLLAVAGWSAVIWLLSWLAMVALLWAFDLRLPPAAGVLLMLAVSVSNLAPTPPALIGLMQGIAVAVLGVYGIDRATAVGVGLALNVVTVAPLLLLGSWAVWTRTLSLAGALTPGSRLEGRQASQ